MESVFLMVIDVLPQSRPVGEFANALATSSDPGEGSLTMERAMGSRDFPPMRIKYLIDNWSSMILDCELVESPAQFLGAAAGDVGVGVDDMDVDSDSSLPTGDVNTLQQGNANGFTASNTSAGIECGVDKLAARAYLGMIERHSSRFHFPAVWNCGLMMHYSVIPLHLSHYVESEEEMLHVLAAHSSLRCVLFSILFSAYHPTFFIFTHLIPRPRRKSYTSTVTPLLDQHYTPYTSEADIRGHLQPATVAMIDRMEGAIFPVTQVITKGLKEGRNKWDARNPVKVYGHVSISL
jgi:hypothetical protein